MSRIRFFGWRAIFVMASLALSGCGSSSGTKPSGGGGGGGGAAAGTGAAGPLGGRAAAAGGSAGVAGGSGGETATGGKGAAGLNGSGAVAGGTAVMTGGGTGITGTGGVGGGAVAAGGAQATGGAAAGGGGATGRGGAGSGGATVAAGGGAGSAVDNPPAGAYGTRATLLASTSEMAVGEAGGKVYVIGGYPSSPAASVTTVAVYTPGINSWVRTTPYPFAIHHPVVVGVAGKLYSLGGQTPSADTERSFEFDPATSVWRELMGMPTARGAGAGAAIGDKIYVVGGRPPAANQLEVYDISENAWMGLPPLPQTFPQRNHLTAVAIGGKIYVAGGRYGGGGFGSPRTASLDIFDPAVGSWSLGAEMLSPPRGGLNGVSAYGCFHIWGGEGTNTGFANDVFPQHDVYNPRTNMWTRLLPLPTPVHGVTGAAFLDGIIYIPGGGTMSGGSSGSNIFQVFRPDPNALCE